jgi:hypothetical protein
MKRIFVIIPVLLFAVNMQGQFFKGVGAFIAATESAHYYDNTEENKKDNDPANFAATYSYYYPQSHISHEYFNVLSFGLFAEMSNNERWRWQTEFEYTKKGAREKEVINAFTGERSGSFATNKYTYIQWNNYAKFYNPIFFASKYYILAGPKIEYLFKSSTPVFSSVSGAFPKFWFSGDVGLGYEFPLFKKWSAFVEYHYNPDLIKHRHNNIKVRNRTFELRVGIMYRPKRRSIDDCNAPRYKGPAY